MADVGLMLYPWDVVHEGPERIVDAIAARGATRLDIATAYHSAEVIAPRRSAAVATVAEANTLHMAVAEDAFSGLRIPQSSIAKQHPALYERLAETASSAGVALGGWAIAFHNTDLATQNPDAAIRSCFGDAFTHGLCPANPRSKQYVIELLDSVARTGYFDRLLVESLSYLLYSHGHPHELWGARLDATTRYLLSLCFCGSCTAEGEQRGIDVAELRAKVAAELMRTWNADHPQGRDPDDSAELASLHFVWPELRAYTQMRLDVVSALVAEAAATTRRHGVALDLSAAVWGRPAQMNWIEGVDVASSFRLADGFVLESYFPTAGEVAREIDHTLAIRQLAASNGGGVDGSGDTARLAVALTLWQSFSPTDGAFRAKVEAVAATGVQHLALYNYGTATSATLGWVNDAVAIMGGAK